ncbi:MAG: Hsp20/alpha crystallin family protein [Verrucomicrobiales bacterium]|nr:Hsp20/alpha crystallin family protein [Verrucomicrobiales bacterium]
MKLIRYTHPLQNLREWDALFGDPLRFFGPFLNVAQGKAARRPAASGVEWYEDDTHFHARVELPGVKREHLRLDAEEGLLRLALEITNPGNEEAGQTSTSRSEYVLRCPEGVRTEGIQARLADGILEVSLPKEEVRKPVSIEIR